MSTRENIRLIARASFIHRYTKILSHTSKLTRCCFQRCNKYIYPSYKYDSIIDQSWNTVQLKYCTELAPTLWANHRPFLQLQVCDLIVLKLLWSASGCGEGGKQNSVVHSLQRLNQHPTSAHWNEEVYPRLAFSLCQNGPPWCPTCKRFSSLLW